MKKRKHIAKSIGPGDTYNIVHHNYVTIYYVIDGVSASENPEKAAKELDKFYSKHILEYSINDQETLNDFLSKGHEVLKLEGITKQCCIAGIAYVLHQKYIFNVGDVRVYGIIKNKIKCLTKDDSILQLLIDSGEIQEESSLYNEQKSFITQSIGGNKKPDFHVRKDRRIYDCILIVSDGIHGCFLHRHMQHMLDENAVFDDFFALLFERSISIDNTDDKTAILIY